MVYSLEYLAQMKTESTVLTSVSSIGTCPLKAFAIDIEKAERPPPAPPPKKKKEKAEAFLIKNCQPGLSPHPPRVKVTTPPNGICWVWKN